MGLSDRDYMRDRARASDRQRPFSPPGKGIGVPWIILFWLAAGFILFKLYSAYLPAKAPQRVSTARVQPQEVATPEIRPSKVPVEAPPRPVRPAEAPVPESPAPRPPSQVADTSGSNTIYLCRAYSGGTFWAQAHCNQHNALIERIAYVPPGLPFDQKVAIASEQQRQNTTAIQTHTTVTRVIEHSGGAQQSECKSLDARVVQLDAMARQPQSGQMQDWISGQRKEARDRQFRLRC